MNIYILLLLCIVQGLTEFLPVSSSGHLLLVEKYFGINDNILLLNLFLHIATLFAVIIFYRKIIIQLIKKPFQPLTYKLIISTSLSVLIAFIYKYCNLSIFFERYLGICFLITALLLLITYIFQKKSIHFNYGEISYKNSIFVGIVQGVAVIPGISRSGSTISSLILSGNNEQKSSEYSFLLSIPIIIGGFILELINVDNFSSLFAIFSPINIIIAFFLTFFTSLLSLKITVKIFKNNKQLLFSIYLLILGLVVIFV